MIRMSASGNTASKAAVNVLSRSRIRNRNGDAVAGVHQEVAGLLGDPGPVGSTVIPAQVDAAAAVLGHDEDVEAALEDGVGVGEVDGEDLVCVARNSRHVGPDAGELDPGRRHSRASPRWERPVVAKSDELTVTGPGCAGLVADGVGQSEGHSYRSCYRDAGGRRAEATTEVTEPCQDCPTHRVTGDGDVLRRGRGCSRTKRTILSTATTLYVDRLRYAGARYAGAEHGGRRVSAEPLVSLDRTTLRERALVALRSAITSGRYRPGDHLGEVELATHLGVSRGTVREALRHLQQEGLVTPGNRGMLRVNTISPTEVRELFRVRAALESLAVTEIIRSADPSRAVAALRDALKGMETVEGDFEAKLEADLGFHLLLCTLSGNSMLVEAWRYLEGRIRVTIMNYESDEKPTMMSRNRHSPIVDAIERGDVDAAVQVVGEHMAGAAAQYAPPDDRS
jgi:DNA-binding GntR family transcriptional regulator